MCVKGGESVRGEAQWQIVFLDLLTRAFSASFLPRVSTSHVQKRRDVCVDMPVEVHSQDNTLGSS